MIKVWLKAFRLPFLTATVIPVILGSTIAWRDVGIFNWLTFWLTLIGVSFLHIGTNLTNDFFDHKTKNDELNLTPTPFSGGSRIIQDGLLPPSMILYAALTFFSLGSIIGLYLTWQLKSATVLLLGIIGVFCAFFYTAFPLKIGYKGLGETVVGLCLGPLVVLGSYYVQTNSLSLSPLWASIPVGILIYLVLLINEFPDCKADEMVNKKTLVVLLGKGKAIRVFHLLLWTVYFYVFLGILLKVLPFYTALIFLTLPISFKIYSISKTNYFRVDGLLPANVATIGLHFSFGALLSIGFALDKIF